MYNAVFLGEEVQKKKNSVKESENIKTQRKVLGVPSSFCRHGR